MNTRTSASHRANPRTTRGPAFRLAVGAILACAALGAVPAMASATASTCTYNPSNKNVIVSDKSGHNGLRVFRVGEQIRVADDADGGVFCPIPGQLATATVTNTERIAIFRSVNNISGGVTIDQSQGPFRPGVTPENDGQSEVEITIVDEAVSIDQSRNTLAIRGGPGYDWVAVGKRGRVNFGFDTDADVDPVSKPSAVIVDGGDGNDDINGLGFAAGPLNSDLADVKLFASGGAGNDTIVGGAAIDDLRGDAGHDRFYSVGRDKEIEGVRGGEGWDIATVDATDFTESVEDRIVDSSVGRLRLAPANLRARAGKTARVNMSWTHPKAWKQLRNVELRLHHNGEPIGKIAANPSSGRLRGHGAVKLIAGGGSRLTHHGKTVTARLAMRLPKSLAGEGLRVDVQATDRDGHRQLEPRAAVIRVAN